MAIPGGFVKDFLEAPRVVRWTSAGLLIVGTALGALSWYGESTGFWDEHGFWLNIASSITGFCFALPAALLLFGKLAGQQAQAAEQRKVRRRVEQDVADFRDELLDPFSATDLRQLLQSVQSLRQRIPAASGRQGQSAQPLHTDFAPLFEAQHQQAWGTGSRPTIEKDHWPNMRSWRSQVDAVWTTLDTELRPRVIEAELPWIDRCRTATTRTAMKDQLVREGRNPWKANGRGGRELHPTVLRYFLEDLEVLIVTTIDLCVRYEVPTGSQTANR